MVLVTPVVKVNDLCMGRVPVWLGDDVIMED
jgi:hypothetical protein